MLHLRQTTVEILRRNWRWRLAQFLEIRWWQRYLRNKPTEQYLADKRTYWKRVLQQLDYMPQPAEEALEVGCGPAGVFILLHDQQSFTAVDPLLKEYRERLSHFQPADYPTVEFQAQPLEKCELAAASFQVIYCFNAINHVSDWQGCLQLITEAAAPGATLLLSSDVHRRSWLRSIFRLLPGDLLHPHQHLAGEYVDALEKLGWDINREALLKPGRIFNYVGWVAKKKQGR